MKFDLDKFKAGQKALTRGGEVATFVGVCGECSASNRLVAHIHGYDFVFTYFASGVYQSEDNRYSLYDLVSMVSRHQALIDSYDPEDTWQISFDKGKTWRDLDHEIKEWLDTFDYRIHPHNDLIKAYKKGAKIEKLAGEFGKGYVDDLNPTWEEYGCYRIKPEPKTKTKTVYEWIHEANVGNVNYFVSLWVADEDVEHFFGLDTPKQKYKTGRSWETEV